MNYKYLIGASITIPLLPILYYQGKRIRSSVPRLPEAASKKGLASENTSRTLKMIAIGESTIAGVGVATHEEGFTGTLAKELAGKLQSNVAWTVYARSGYTARKIRERIVPQIAEDRADLIVVGLGGNDAFTLNTPARWRRDITELISALWDKFNDTPIFFTNMPPIKTFPAFTPLIKYTIGNLVEILGENLRTVSEKIDRVYYNAEKITLLEWIDRFDVKAPPSNFFSDGVHPSKLTYQTWARDFANFILDTHNFTNTYPSNE